MIFYLPERGLVVVAVVGAAVGGFWVEPAGGVVLKNLNFLFSWQPKANYWMDIHKNVKKD